MTNPDYGELLSMCLEGDRNAQLQCAVLAMQNVQSLEPGPYPGPTGSVASLISSLDASIRNGESQVVANLLADKDAALVLGSYRERLTYAEAANSRKLEQLAWSWSVATRSAVKEGDVASTAARILEECAVRSWRLDGLATTRGWAMGVCRRYDLLPVSVRLIGLVG